MEKKYRKIDNVFKFDEKFRTIVGLNELYEDLAGLVWIGTEKVDGTNIRVNWDGERITYAGHTDKSQIPTHLNEYLKNLFLTPEMEYVFEQMFGEKEVYIFGEDYGEKIQNGGGNYMEDGHGVSFIIFDINIGGYDLKYEDVCDIANRLGIPVVPKVFEGNLEQAKEYVKAHQLSTLNEKHEMEGLVLTPKARIFDSHGNTIKCKLKYRDICKEN